MGRDTQRLDDTFTETQVANARAGNSGTLYTSEERRRRDESIWTTVQGVLAPLQFLVFLISLGLVVRYLVSGEGAFAADVSIVIKTLTLYTIMITGSVWEKVVFGRWLFAPAFFWEDVFSMLVLALHTLYIVMLLGAIGSIEARMMVALAAYAAYVINAGQFLLKLRAARLQGSLEAEAVPA
ncbi:MAG: 2-vinyl bacteriochlorophyllide hydratase [Pseudomonadota bacterium]